MIFDTVKNIIVENLGCEANAVVKDATLIDDLGADSLDAVELSMALEDEFEIEIEDEDFAALKTVGDICTYIESRQS